ncbi:MAG TPA: protein-L-isoaspartate O-methyltransferase [Burkholderiales bacterium]|jgi:protein-L-isoaspartate(D-aspartate) O-methyltransferase|nr:protein-L-isoaspartate O-methyltransferase [Burkholderiales bacterium]
MNLEQARSNMVEQQIRPWEVLDQDVLDLLYAVPREEFVPPAYRNLAFSDLEIPLRKNAAEGERMWAPKIEARVLQAVAPRRSDRVLEVGTGSGYLTALFAHRAAQVCSVEINPELAAFGKANIARHGLDNVQLQVGDGARGVVPGFPFEGPFDVILLTGSVPLMPRGVLEALSPGGRAFAVVGEPPVMTARIHHCVAPGDYRIEELFETLLAPLANCERPSRFKF